MKICYLMLIHHKFDQAKRLIKKLANTESCFVIHIDAKVDQTVYNKFIEDISDINSIYFSKRINVKWGAYSLAEAIMETILHAVDCAKINSPRFMLVSGQEYPIVSNNDIFEFLNKHSNEEFIEAHLLDFTEDKSKTCTPYYRFVRYHFWFGRKHISTNIIKKKLPSIPIYHGSAWWLLTKDAISYIANEYKHNQKLKKFFSSGFYVDEAYIHTLLMSSPFSKNVTYHNVTYTDWRNPTGPHPKTLGKNDLSDMRRSNCLVARKFDYDHDHEIFDILDNITT